MQKHHDALVKGWAKISPEKRSERMRHVATQKNKNMSKEARVALARKMAMARWAKHKKNLTSK